MPQETLAWGRPTTVAVAPRHARNLLQSSGIQFSQRRSDFTLKIGSFDMVQEGQFGTVEMRHADSAIKVQPSATCPSLLSVATAFLLDRGLRRGKVFFYERQTRDCAHSEASPREIGRAESGTWLARVGEACENCVVYRSKLLEFRRYRLRVRTWPSQGQNPGSNPGIATKGCPKILAEISEDFADANLTT